MTTGEQSRDQWSSGDAYWQYIGRWSRLVAREFLDWLSLPSDLEWLDVGCGTGALSQTILAIASPSSITGIDRSAAYLAYAAEHVRDERAHFRLGDAQSIALPDRTCDAAVAGLVLNHVSDPPVAIREMARVSREGGTVAAYVWDYAGKMELIRYFWDAAVALDPAAEALDQGRRYPLCQPDPLAALFKGANLVDVAIRPIDVLTVFVAFDDYWKPLLGGQGPAGAYVASLTEDHRTSLRGRLQQALPLTEDGSIRLTARAWAARGRKAG